MIGTLRLPGGRVVWRPDPGNGIVGDSRRALRRALSRFDAGADDEEKPVPQLSGA